MLPYTSRGFHQEKSRRFLEEVNRDFRRVRSSQRSERLVDRLARKVGAYLIDLGEALVRYPQVGTE